MKENKLADRTHKALSSKCTSACYAGRLLPDCKGEFMNTFTIRECTPGDFDAIQKLNAEEMGYTYPLDATAHKLQTILGRPSDKVFVAVADGAVVGYVHACDYDVIYAPHMKNIMGIAVAATHKRQGIGRALLSQVEAWAKATGAAGVRLVSGSERRDAHRFYRGCGYSGNKEQINFKKMF